MFTDKIKLNLKSGKGGNGCVSFYRAKYIARGGPDGGDGGDGGCIIVESSQNLASLSDYRNRRNFKAENGEDGGPRNRSGKKGQDMVIKVPCGTIIKEASTGRVITDMSEDKKQFVLLKGGRGGWGNQHFATASRQAPRFAKSGSEAKELDVTFELKLIADVGIIGFPNAGKSTLLSMVTNANPKIADYHFTTLAPNLGMVSGLYGNEFIIADIPGLIEGASGGAGLGFEFLRHIERTKVLIHVVDAAGLEGEDPLTAIEKINRELELYNPELLKRPQIIAANKMDIPEASINYEKIKLHYEPLQIPVFPISAATNAGLSPLIEKAAQILENYPEDIVFHEEYEEYREEEIKNEPFTIEIEDGVFIVKGIGIIKMLGYTDIGSDKGFVFFQKYLKDKGIIKQLEDMGVSDGDTVRLYDLEFDYYKYCFSGKGCVI